MNQNYNPAVGIETEALVELGMHLEETAGPGLAETEADRLI